MVKQLFEEIKKGINLRDNLSRLRVAVKEDNNLNDLFELVEEDSKSLSCFLKNDDPKVRKNTALIMGALEMTDYLDCLVEAYKTEEQLFVRSAYLEALKNYEYSEYLPFIKEKVEKLMTITLTDENKKHISEELKGLTELIIKVEGITHHTFRGWKVEGNPLECILLTNKLCLDVTQKQLEYDDVEVIPYKAGVRIKTNNLRHIKNIRTYSDVLFVIPGFDTSDFDPVKVAEALAGSKLINLLEKTHTGKVPFYFRIELKSNLDLEKKSKFTKRLAAELEFLSGRKLLNSTSDYEIEIRLIESRDGKINALLKLYTIEDNRFAYFNKHVAASIKPVNAALIAQLAKEYMRPDAQVIDPFCGVGTMLIERHKAVPANTMYGLDINAEAIQSAKENTELAGQIAHYINRDFFTFTHEYLFDEIITDMPFSVNDKNVSEIEGIYKKFFVQAKKVLKEQGTIIMFSRNPLFAEIYAKKSGLKIEKRYAMSPKDDVAVFVIKMK